MPGPGSGDQFDPANGKAEVAAEKARAAARESAAWLRDETSRLVVTYKKQSKYFKWRSWIIGGYTVIALASLFMVFRPRNPIQAYLRVTRDELDGRALLYVQNRSLDDWTRIKLIIDEQWAFERERMLPGEEATMNISQFRRIGATGPAAKPGADVVPHRIVVKCDQGSFEDATD